VRRRPTGLDDPDALRSWLAAVPLRAVAPGLLEEFLVGDEHTFDSVQIGGRTVWASVADYLPPPLGRAAQPVDPVDGVAAARADDPRYAAIATSARPPSGRWVRDGLTHMEWFRRPDGTVAVSEVAARPPGAQLSAMLGYVHEVDFQRIWCELVLLGRFDPPERKYAAGCAYLRGQGPAGRPEPGRAVHGVEELQRRSGTWVVEARLPAPGQPRRRATGEGYVIVRHPDTGVVRNAVREVVEGIRVELVEVG
jgi:hypothetical protein